MNRTGWIALVVGALLFGCGAGMVAHEVMVPRAAAAWEGEKWEYHCVKLWKLPAHLTEPEGDAKLDALGAEGWELVQLGIGYGEGTSETACFKRRLN